MGHRQARRARTRDQATHSTLDRTPVGPTYAARARPRPPPCRASRLGLLSSGAAPCAAPFAAHAPRTYPPPPPRVRLRGASSHKLEPTPGPSVTSGGTGVPLYTMTHLHPDTRFGRTRPLGAAACAASAPKPPPLPPPATTTTTTATRWLAEAGAILPPSWAFAATPPPTGHGGGWLVTAGRWLIKAMQTEPGNEVISKERLGLCALSAAPGRWGYLKAQE